MTEHAKNTTKQSLKKQPKRKWLTRLLWTVMVLIVTIFASLYYLLATTSGTKVALFSLPKMAGVHITADNLQGTIWSGISAENIAIKLESIEIYSKKLVYTWHSKKLTSRLLHLDQLIIGEVWIKPLENKDKTSTPAKLPSLVGPPLINIIVDKFENNGILLGDNKEILINAIDGQYSYLNKQHQLLIHSARNPWTAIEGTVVLENIKPFKLSGQLDIDGYINDERVEGYIEASGSLEEIELTSYLVGLSMLADTEINIRPFEPLLTEKLKNIQISLGSVNPQNFYDPLPSAKLSSQIDIHSSNGQLNGKMMTVNNDSKRLEENGLPFQSIATTFSIDKENLLKLQQLDVQFLDDGQLHASGNMQQFEELDFTIDIDNISAKDILKTNIFEQINGQINIKGNIEQPKISWDLNENRANINGLLYLEKNAFQNTLFLEDLVLSTKNGGKLNAHGSLQLFDAKTLDIKIESNNFNPANIDPDYPQGKINGLVAVKGSLINQPNMAIDLNIDNSILSSEKLTGKGTLAMVGSRIINSSVNINLGANIIKLSGNMGDSGDKLNVDINAPSLNQFGFGLHGLFTAKGSIAGEYKKPQLNIAGKANNLAFRNMIKANKLDFQLQASIDENDPLDINIKGHDLLLADTIIRNIDLISRGTLKQHYIDGKANLRLSDKDFITKLNAQGGLNQSAQWEGIIKQLDLDGDLKVSLHNPVKFKVGSDVLDISSATWKLLNGNLKLQHLAWQKDSGFTSKGEMSSVQLKELEKFMSLPVKQDIVLAGKWDLKYNNNNPSGFISINRQSGDIIIPQHSKKLGLQDLSLNVELKNGLINHALKLNTLYGTADAHLSLNASSNLAEAPMKGDIKIIADDLAKFKYFLPIGMNIGGRLTSNMTLSGNVKNFKAQGAAHAEDILFHDLNNGIKLNNGQLTSRFVDTQWIIDSLNFKDKNGDINLSGHLGLIGNQADINLKLQANQFKILNQPDKQVTFSGESQILFNENSGLTMLGDLSLDEGLFDFPKSTMPQLGDDVVIVGQERKKASDFAFPIAMDLKINLNDKFIFSGQGLNVLMGGKLHLKAQPKEEITLVGVVNIVNGRYRAYGQDLEVETGMISFVGPISNPLLKIRARRRLSPVGVGADISGNVENPRLTLIANEPMSDKDKLSWLVLGRAAAGSSDNDALALAAGSMLAGGLNEKIGLFDDFGLSSRETRNASTGEMNPAEQMVTMGKQISDKVYFGYEYGIDSAEQAVKLVYSLTNSIQVIGRVGSISSGGEIRYSIRFD